ncbi:MAG: Rieske 2Fe-2S domain-containing protein [Deltaproteobacteria bacterium]|jgi:nitrite reductase/ring-hydroxylating ferredoxin subunit|nr:Rieske 2Fe-2S domain-containing protein [Deltaproteobacteria bacterium]MBT4091915.1 Rieske 2Fe-2S domain-containing protein [Deltaproteobacteria bacterium]MBT4266008.1 Rieske 2Fe-2S domain-containing protein [Deltaproteobacteria bacterium]MBT4641806.1 Rieske 2Fe-2S domain-containing protein [Deltaproteobacteria bacterium]MBT6500751.1 Rieske 2Fe-2S domain-containing protein [Deltaproteobacteria bacterium]
MEFHPLEKKENLFEGYKSVFQVGEISLLLIQHNAKTALIENRCGHFGYELESGKIETDTIVCSQHGISFSLITGEIANRPYENADPIRIFDIVCQDGFLGVVL